jgi:ketosteroid isomerase-like protein
MISPQDRAAILLAIARFKAAYDSGNLEGIAVCYSDDLVKVRQGAPPETKPEVIARIAAVLRDYAGRVEVDNEELEGSGDFAFTRGSFIVTLTPKAGGVPKKIKRRYLELWRKERGTWLVIRTMDNSGGE